MIKGKTTIQLFDANTDELTDEVSSENMVTNAVKNVLGAPFNFLAQLGDNYVYNYLYSLDSAKNFAQTFFGGVLIFSSAIEEDAKHCLPSIDEIKANIGCGCQSAGLTGNSFRGSINSAETVVGADYVTFVWDFNTDQCNGDIASICLTSDAGGTVGWGFDSAQSSFENASMRRLADSDIVRQVSSGNLSSITTALGGSISQSSSNAGKCSYFDDNYFYYVYRGTCYKFDISTLLKNGSGLIYGCNSRKSVKLVDTINTGISVYQDFIYTSKDIGYCRDGDIQKDTLKLIKYSGSGVAERVNIPFANVTSAIYNYLGYSSVGNLNSISADMCIHKNKVYIFTGQFNFGTADRPNKARVYIVNLDGTYTYKDVSVSDKLTTNLVGTSRKGGYADVAIGVHWGLFRGSLILYGSQTPNAGFLVDDDGTMQPHACIVASGLYAQDYMLEDSNKISNPYIMQLVQNSSGEYIFNPILVTPYLATINNQETVLTKTADKTMKIIYTLTQA